MSARSWSRWLNRLFPAASRPATQCRARLRLEDLEGRWNPTPVISRPPGILTVNTAADTVDSTDDKLSLREAFGLIAGTLTVGSLSTAERGQVTGTPGSGTDTIQFDPSLAGQTITLQTIGDVAAGQTALGVKAGESVSVNGLMGNAGVTLSGNGTGSNLRAFFVPPTSTLTLSNLTLSHFSVRGGDGGAGAAGGGGGAGLGGAILNAGTLNLIGDTLTGDTATGGSGGTGNATASFSGGGGSSAFAGGIGTPSYGGGGGGVGGVGGMPSGGANEFGNAASTGAGTFGGGGAGDIYNGGSGAAASSAGLGGGGAGTLAGFYIITNNNFGGDGGFGGGGGGSYDGGVGGFGGGGGGSEGFFNVGGFGGGRGGFYGGGFGAGMGGAVFNDGGTLEVVDSTFFADSAVGGSGNNGLLTGNSGQGLGGAIFSRNGTVSLNHATLSGDSADAGRGLYVVSDGSGNAAVATIDNSILAQADAAKADYASGIANGGTAPSSSGSHDLIGNQTAFGGTAASSDPQLGAALGNFGGPTQTLHFLSASSPAVGAGNAAFDAAGNLTVDQRGFSRTGNGTVDIGAVELQVPTATLVSAPPATAGAGGNATTTVVVQYAGAEGIDSSTFGTDDIAVGGGTVTGFSAAGNAVSYAVTAPVGDHAISLAAGGVKGLDGLGVAGNAALGSFAVTGPAAAPVVGPAAAPVFSPVVSATAYPYAGGTVVNVVRADGSNSVIDPFPRYRGPVFTALSDATGDGVPDVVAAIAEGPAVHYRVYDGKTGALVEDLYAFEFPSGTTVVVGNFGDGQLAVQILRPGLPPEGPAPVSAAAVQAYFAPLSPAFRDPSFIA